MLEITARMDGNRVESFCELHCGKPFTGLLDKTRNYFFYQVDKSALKVELDDNAKWQSVVKSFLNQGVRANMVSTDILRYARIEHATSGEVLHLERKKRFLFGYDYDLTARLEVPEAADGGFAFGPLFMTFIAALVGNSWMGHRTPTITQRVVKQVRTGPAKSYYPELLGEIQKEILENRGTALTRWDTLTLACLYYGNEKYLYKDKGAWFHSVVEYLVHHVTTGLAVPPKTTVATIEEMEDAAIPEWQRESATRRRRAA
jgi:hypothetical protein